ncbi:MAG: phosphohistidine phosphatase SixA [Acidobacteria bacterium]|nr:phosphohistidine phosphatase SixA [Acidobacteriota bacterium]
MKVYLMRHGEAAARQGDAEPGLTLNGERQADDTARALVRQGAKVEVVYHSGKRRARETAQLVASKLNPKRGTEVRAGLCPDDSIFELAALIEELGEPALFVSHLPLLDHVAGLLVEGNAGANTGGFATGEVVCLESDAPGEWRVTWKHRPKSS